MVKGIVSLDPWMFPVQRMDFRAGPPLKVINSEAFYLKENVKAVEEVVKDSTQKADWEILGGGVHLSATDIPMIFPQAFLRKGLGFMSSVSPEDVMKRLNRSVYELVLRLSSETADNMKEQKT